MKSSAQSPIAQFNSSDLRVLAGWLMTVILPLIVYRLSQSTELGTSISMFISAVSMAVCMWIFNLTPAFAPALLILVATILFDIAPKETALAGFTSDAFFICLGIFILAAQVASSGLIYRAALIMMRWFPESELSQSLIISASGGFLSTILPSPLGRAALINPLVFELIEKGAPVQPVKDRPKKNIVKGQPKKNVVTRRPKKNIVTAPTTPNMTPLIISGLQGTTLLSTIFLTGNPLNLVMLGFFNAQTQYRFQWLYWLQATILVGAILVVGYVGILYWLTRKSAMPPMSKARIDTLLKNLGPMKDSEWGALIGISAFGIGILSQTYHHIEPVWLAVGIALVLYFYGALTAKDLRSNIDWPTLLFVAAIVSWGPIMSHIGLDALIFKQVGALGLNVLLQNNLSLGIGFLAIIIILIRFAFPGGPTFVILMSALIPLANNAGISPWVLGFIALTLSEAFILPHQHGVPSLMIEELKTRGLENSYSARDVLISNVLLLALRLVAVYVSIFYWRAIAII